MSTSKSYDSVTDLLKGIGADSAFAKSVEEEIQSRSIGRALVVLRHKAALTQADVAEKMQVKQSTISKIERSTNSELRMGEIESFLRAVGGKMNIAVHGSKATLSDQVKFHVCHIHRLLHQLAALTAKDESLGVHVNNFFGEALFNFVKSVESASSKVRGVSDEQNNIEFYDMETLADLHYDRKTDDELSP